MNKWLTMGVTPTHIAASLPLSQREIKSEKHRKWGVIGGRGGKGKSLVRRKNFIPQLQKLYEKFGHNEFTYHDVVELFGVTRYAADKLLLMIRRRSSVLTHRKSPRSYKGNTPALYSLKPGWEEQVVKDLEAFNAANECLTEKNTIFTL